MKSLAEPALYARAYILPWNLQCFTHVVVGDLELMAASHATEGPFELPHATLEPTSKANMVKSLAFVDFDDPTPHELFNMASILRTVGPTLERLFSDAALYKTPAFYEVGDSEAYQEFTTALHDVSNLEECCHASQGLELIPAASTLKLSRLVTLNALLGDIKIVVGNLPCLQEMVVGTPDF
ncbi:hypothetical protein FRB94_007407 [Tulasnella sp. JGI-2019a]|nr:hypothetical protein FRB94_007407 [Tulasnella sp. JGI-2019a]